METPQAAERANLEAHGRWRLLLLVPCGVLMATAFAPLRWHWLAVPCLLLLLASMMRFPAAAGRAGFLFGLGLFGSGVSWVYISLSRFGNMSPVLASLAVVLFVVYLALYPALAGYALQFLNRSRFGRNRILPVFLFPFLWVLQEYARAWLLTGFPWLNIGYSQTASPLTAYTPVLGVYGLSWLCALLASLLWLAIHYRGRRRWVSLTGVCLILGTGLLLRQANWVTPAGDPLKVAMVQANIPLGGEVAGGKPASHSLCLSGHDQVHPGCRPGDLARGCGTRLCR